MQEVGPTWLCRLFDYPFYLASVDIEFAGDGSLAVARIVACPYQLLQRWRFRSIGWYIRFAGWLDLAVGLLRGCLHDGAVVGSYKCHEQFVGTDQRHSGPGAD